MERLEYARAIYGDPEKQAVRRSLDSGWLSGGPETLAFEREFTQVMKNRFALSVNSGSSADIVALQALGLPRGSEVITPAGAAFPTTIAPMVYLGLRPVFVDVDGLLLDLKEVEKAIGPDTKAIMFAHTLGQMPDMAILTKIARDNGLRVVEDVCDAVGSTQNGKLAGTFGDMATVSLYPAHHITTGEGGMVLTNNPKLFREAGSIRDWGRDCTCTFEARGCMNRFGNPPFDHRYYYTRIGGNFKMNEMTAAFGREQLKRLEGFIELRRRNYRILAEELHEPYNPEISPFAYPIFSRHKMRDMEFLNEQGIDTRTLFAGNILRHPAFKDIDCRVVGDLSGSDKVLNEAYFVGVGPHLTPSNMLYIADKIKQCSQ